MEWMKDILGDELYKEFEAKITAHNEAAKEDEDKIKLANLALGKYTGTDHHDGEVGRLTAGSPIDERHNRHRPVSRA